MDDDPLYTTAEVAGRLRVHPETVRQWLRDGEMRGTILGRKAGWRVAGSELRRFIEEGPLQRRPDETGKAAA
jgi:excisionase family DNA binding protein